MTNNIDKKILVVEDDEDFVFILEKKLSSNGFSVITAKDGQEGLALAQKEKPDAILSDMLMPKMDGMAMAKKLRETDPNTPIIFLTNINNVDDVEAAKKTIAFDYLIKSNTKMDDIVTKLKEKLGI